MTGSKTLFVANDDAFTRFFQNNVWGAKSYSDLTPSQKKLLFNSSMINSAYLIELMSSTPGDNPAPGTVMRRSSSLNLYDTIPQLRASDMPDNEYWQYYRSKYSDAATGGMTVFRDNTTAPMVHFLSAYMSNKSITNDDLKFLTNGACDNTSESYINGQRLVERDITCQNGYIQVLENVMNPLTNMAEAIHNDGELSTFSKMLDRFAVPVYNEGLSNTVGVDSAFVWRYLNNGFDLGTEGGKNALLTYKNVDYANRLLKFEQSKTKGHSASSGVVIPLNDGLLSIIGEVPTDKNCLIFDLSTYESCCKSVKRWVKRAGIDKHISWHLARHSFAVNILNNGANIKTVASLLGHSGLKHTEKYTRAVDKLKEEAINSLPELKF